MGDLRDLLNSMVGEWTGRYRLYLEPGTLTSESDTSATVTPALDGRFVRITYDWTVDDGRRQLGEFLVAAPGGDRLVSSWVDTWHNGDGILFCDSDGPAAVIGRYGPDEDPWRWRTLFEVRDGGAELAITAWNITPAGDEAVATEATYQK